MFAKSVREFRRKDTGAVAIEYVLIGGFMAVILVIVFAAFGNGLDDSVAAIEFEFDAELLQEE